MSARARTVIAIVCAVLAVVLVLMYAAGVRNEAAATRSEALKKYGGETAQVCVTTRAVSRGEAFTERNIETRQWLVDLLPEGVLQDTSQVLGSISSSDIAANTPLSSVNIDIQAEPLEVPVGLSALSVPCSVENAVGGDLAVGSRADVYVVSDGLAHLLCRSAQVIETSMSATNSSLSWVTLAVYPDMVESIIAASSLQQLYFVLPSEEAARLAEQEDAAQETQAQQADAQQVADQAINTDTDEQNAPQEQSVSSEAPPDQTLDVEQQVAL